MPYTVEMPVPDSQFRLCHCKGCKSKEVGYQVSVDENKARFRVKCCGCGKHTPWWPCKHDAQFDWNSRFGEGFWL